MIFFVVLALGFTTVVTNIVRSNILVFATSTTKILKFEALHYTYSFEEGTCISNVGLRERTQDM